MQLSRSRAVITGILFAIIAAANADASPFGTCVPAGVKRFTFSATLFEAYGTLTTGETLTATLQYDPTTRQGAYVVAHETGGGAQRCRRRDQRLRQRVRRRH